MRFEVYRDTSEKYRWRLWSGSNKVAASGESFASKSNADRAATGFKSGAKTAKYTIFGSDSTWYWNARPATGGNTMASGGESFSSEYSAQRAADNVRDNAGSATGP